MFAVFADKEKRPHLTTKWILKNEIKPVDLYCYLGARFGRPNGLQNFLRADDSNNLIHWDWFVSFEDGFISFLGMSFRTEILLFGEEPLTDQDKEKFIHLLKCDFAKHGHEMGKIRKS